MKRVSGNGWKRKKNPSTAFDGIQEAKEITRKRAV
jgi:hypothetical protein